MAEVVYAIDEFPDDDLLWRIEWVAGVGYNADVPSDPLIECLPGAASRGRDESAQREIAFLSQTNREDQCWLATLHLNCFGLAATTTSNNGFRGLPPSTAHRYIIVSNGGFLGDVTSSGNAIPRSSTCSVRPGHMSAEPLAVAQIDHTPMDVIVVDEEHRQPIQRPSLTDVYSRMVLGFATATALPQQQPRHQAVLPSGRSS